MRDFFWLHTLSCIAFPTGGLDIAAPGVAQCANALWQCVNYQSEGVATQVIQVLTCAFQAKILDDFLSLISTTEVNKLMNLTPDC